MRVLFVHGESSLAAKAESMLTDEGIDVLSLTLEDNLVRTVQTQEEGIDLMLFDVGTMGTHAFDQCSMLKANPDLFLIPIVLLTDGTTEQITRGLNLGATDCIRTPLDGDEFVARIFSALRTKGFLDMLLKNAGIDPFTAIGNYNEFLSRVENELDRRRRYGGDFAVLALAVDDYSGLTDMYGSKSASEVMRQTAQTLPRQSRRNDYVARHMEARFLVLACGTVREKAEIMANRLAASIREQEFAVGGDEIDVTISVGISDSTEYEEADDIIHAAGVALSVAQQTGDSVQIHTADGKTGE